MINVLTDLPVRIATIGLHFGEARFQYVGFFAALKVRTAIANTFLCFEYGALRGRVEAYRTNIVSDKGPVLWVTLVSVDTCWSRTLVGIDSKQLSCRILLFWGLKVDVDMR